MSMKRTSRILSLALAIVLVVSCMGIQAFAADESNVKQYGQVDKDGYGGYLAIGDSIARGMGVQDYADNGMQSIFYKWECRNVPGSYPYIIAKAVGCNTPESINDASGNFWPCCYPGMTTTEVVDLIGIEDNYYDEAFRQIHSRYKNQAVPYFGCEETVDGLGTSGTAGNIRDLCQRASLITIGLGMGDVLFRAKELAFREESTLDKVTTMVKEMYAGFEQWKISYPILIDYLQEVNPEATIVLTGAVNFSLNLTLTDDSLLPVADALSVIFTQMNWYIRQLASEKGCL